MVNKLNGPIVSNTIDTEKNNPVEDKKTKNELGIDKDKFINDRKTLNEIAQLIQKKDFRSSSEPELKKSLLHAQKTVHKDLSLALKQKEKDENALQKAQAELKSAQNALTGLSGHKLETAQKNLKEKENTLKNAAHNLENTNKLIATIDQKPSEELAQMQRLTKC